MVEPEFHQLEKAHQYATSMAAYNQTIHQGSFTNTIKVSQISRLGDDVVVSMTKLKEFKDEDVKFIMSIADTLVGTVTFKTTGEIDVNF